MPSSNQKEWGLTRRLCSAGLYCTILYCASLNSTVMYSAMISCPIMQCTVPDRTVQSDTQ
jgi:hypothetical protein